MILCNMILRSAFNVEGGVSRRRQKPKPHLTLSKPCLSRAQSREKTETRAFPMLGKATRSGFQPSLARQAALGSQSLDKH